MKRTGKMKSPGQGYSVALRTRWSRMPDIGKNGRGGGGCRTLEKPFVVQADPNGTVSGV